MLGRSQRPALDPADKRLAMQVEDHPVSYFDFEGTIPEGNYGAGTVMVWDMGSWEPKGDAAEMMRKGDLKFRLNGQKLKGDFALVHMKARRPGSKGTEWLLIKHRDAYVQPGYDIDQYDYSVLTKRSLDQIAHDAGSAEWTSSRKLDARRLQQERLAGRLDCESRCQAGEERSAEERQESGGYWRGSSYRSGEDGRETFAERSFQESHPCAGGKKKLPEEEPNLDSNATRLGRKAAMPHVIRPMLATIIDKPFDDQDWLYEVKWDGYRAITYLDSVRRGRPRRGARPRSARSGPGSECREP